MKVAYHSVSPLIKSGYGRCTAELVYRLLDEFDVDIYAYFGLTHSEIDLDIPGPSGPRRVRVVGNTANSLRHTVLEERADAYDLCVTHCDMWATPKEFAKSNVKLVWWVIGDHSPVPIGTKESILLPNMVKVVPMTDWFRNELARWPSCPAEKIADPIPHGIDLERWRPYDGDSFDVPKRTEFVVVTVAANYGPRENIPAMLEAFAIFLKRTKANAYYYVHAEPVREHGFNLVHVCQQLEEAYGVSLGGKVGFKASRVMLPDEFLKSVYTRADCQLMTVMGGSFEIPILEAAACGTPTITIDFSGPGELVGHGERGLVVPPKAPVWMNLTSSRQYAVDPNDVADALTTYYENPKLREEHASKMLEWIRENATWDIVADKWKRLLKSILEPERKIKIRKAGAGKRRW